MMTTVSDRSAIEVVLADDAEHYRRGLAAVLATEPHLLVVGEAASGEDLLELVARWAPDVAIVDLRMPGMGGVAAIAALGRLSPVTGVLVLTVSDEEDDLLAAMAAGARGYLLKEAAIDDVPAAVRQVALGGAPLSPVVAEGLWRRYSELRTAGAITGLLAPEEERALRLRASGDGDSPIDERRLANAAEKVRIRARCVTDARGL